MGGSIRSHAARLSRQRPRSGRTASVSRSRPARVEPDHPVGDVEIVLVVADDQQRLARGPQLGEDLVVEDPLEVRVLVARPTRRRCRSGRSSSRRPAAPAAAAGPRQVGASRTPPLDPDRPVEPQPVEPVAGPRVEVRAVEAEQVVNRWPSAKTTEKSWRYASDRSASTARPSSRIDPASGRVEARRAA